MMDSLGATRLLERILDRTARVGVVGLGYVGLPLAVELAGAGFRTTAFDTDEARVGALSEGRSYLPDVLGSDIARLCRSGKLAGTADATALAELDAVAVCVPTPRRRTSTADVSPVIEAIEQIATHLHSEMLVVVESAMYPAATDEVVLTILEATGFRAGRDYFLATAPERIDPGNRFYSIPNIPKVIGGVTKTCTRLASALYGTIAESIISVSSTRAAEMVTLLEATFRTVNIAVVNELALMCDRMDLDVWEVINAARTKPFGFMPFHPGPGMGRCELPLAASDFRSSGPMGQAEPRLVDIAEQVNAAMPCAVVNLVTEALASRGRTVRGASILIAGIAYKRNVDAIQESPALDVTTLLAARGARITYSDPLVPSLPADAWGGSVALESIAMTPEAIGSADCVVILTDHSAFDLHEIVAHARLVVDVRNATGGCGSGIFRLGAPRPQGSITMMPHVPRVVSRSHS